MPGTGREEVKVLEYSDRLKIFQAGQSLAEYPLPADGVRGAKFSPRASRPPTTPTIATVPPKWKRSTAHFGAQPSAPISIMPCLKGFARHQFLRRLLALSRKMSVELFARPGTRPQISHHRPGNPPEHRLVISPTTEPGPGAPDRNRCRLPPAPNLPGRLADRSPRVIQLPRPAGRASQRLLKLLP